MLKPLLYFGFFVLKTDYPDLLASVQCASRRGYGRVRLICDMIYCSFRHGSSFVDYFNFQFYRKNIVEREAYATMGYMYRFHKIVNAPHHVPHVDSKERFPNKFGNFCNPSFIFQPGQRQILEKFLRERVGQKVVVKDPESTAGRGVMVLSVEISNDQIMVDGASIDTFYSATMREKGLLYLEDFIFQHRDLDNISPSGVNTIRVITMINDQGDVDILGSIFRISVNSKLDNFSAGNLAAEIDLKTGKVVTGGIRKRSTCDEYHDHHPLTGAAIKGFQIPHWPAVLTMVCEAARVVPQVRSVGWDIAIKSDGPVIIEGNSKWNKDTWQIPAGYGKKKLIALYIRDRNHR